MALQLNLLHEQFAEERQRQRDPLKLGVLILCGLGVLMLAFYMWKAYQTLEMKNRLNAVQRGWEQVEPKVTAAQKRSLDLTATIDTTRVLDTLIEDRFYWGSFLERLSRCVAPNTQLTSLEGSVSDDNKVVSVTLDGIAAGGEPRAASEEFRQLLLEQLHQSYSEVKVEFKTLEDLDTSVNIAGSNMATAHFVLGVSLSPLGLETAKAAAVSAPRAPKK
ncbi:MAG: hypothetical protein H0W04_09375 [Chthoniobacterales bacterium]|nr:hypothetical protein [Chthoniobacterales bacterium]